MTTRRLDIFRQGLITALLLLGCILGLQATSLMVQVASLLQTAEQELLATSREAQATLIRSQAVLASVRGTTETVRESAVHQMGYYEAMGRRSASALARMELFIQRMDTRMERATTSLEDTSAHASQSFHQAGTLLSSLRSDAAEIAKQSHELMESSTSAVRELHSRLADDRLDRMAAAIAESSEYTAQASANVAEATGYVRDMLSPARKSFWRRLLDLLIPRPAPNSKKRHEQ
jgi:hypothetical protein